MEVMVNPPLGRQLHSGNGGGGRGLVLAPHSSFLFINYYKIINERSVICVSLGSFYSYDVLQRHRDVIVNALIFC